MQEPLRTLYGPSLERLLERELESGPCSLLFLEVMLQPGDFGVELTDDAVL